MHITNVHIIYIYIYMKLQATLRYPEKKKKSKRKFPSLKSALNKNATKITLTVLNSSNCSTKSSNFSHNPS